MAVLKGEGRVQFIYGRSPLPSPPYRPVYLARPNDSGTHPSVVVLHDVEGQTPSVRDLCRRLARYGYVAVAPDLYRGKPEDSLPERRALRDGVEVAETLMGAWGDFADPKPPAVVALGQAALVGARLAAETSAPLALVAPPIDGLAAELGARGPLLSLMAGAEGGDADTVRSLHAEVGRGEWVVFPGVSRTFMDDSSDDYDDEAASDGFDRLVAFLDRVLSPAIAA